MQRTIAIAAPFVLSALLAACGSKAPSPTVGNTGTGGAAAGAVPAGIHACQFVVDGAAMGPHRCDVADGTLDKLSGMEPFAATFAEAAGALNVTATIGCGQLTSKCNQAFTVELRKDGGTWRGPVVADDPDWFLSGATFELTDEAGYGGAGYGGATYGE